MDTHNHIEVTQNDTLLPSHLKLIGMHGGDSRGQRLIIAAEDALEEVCIGRGE